MAKNNIAEYGGFSPTQSLFGTAPTNWYRTEVAETPEERMQDTLYKQMLAKRAVEQAIYESRLAIAMRGKKPETDRTKIQVGQQIEVFVKPDKKDVSGWRRPCTVISIDTACNIEYRWQGVIRKTPTHLTCLLYTSPSPRD